MYIYIYISVWGAVAPEFYTGFHCMILMDFVGFSKDSNGFYRYAFRVLI